MEGIGQQNHVRLSQFLSKRYKNDAKRFNQIVFSDLLSTYLSHYKTVVYTHILNSQNRIEQNKAGLKAII